MRIFKHLLMIKHHPLAGGVIMLLITLIAIASAVLLTLPAVPTAAAVRAAYVPSDAVLKDRHGAVLHSLRVDARGRRFPWQALAAISPVMLQAVIAQEDRRFYQHRGVDLLALAAAARDALRGQPRGASTITMQVAALLKPATPASGSRGLREKWAQMRAAWALEQHWRKAEILEAYLNLASFRGELQGIHAASRALFDKAASGLSADEAAILAALLRAPNASAEKVMARACRQRGPAACKNIHARLADLSRVNITPPRALAAHVARLLLSPAQREVSSSLDADLQTHAQIVLDEQLAALGNERVQDGAVLVADNHSGEVLAYVGNSARYSRAHYVDGVRAPRQAGSTLKPFLYALALEQRLLTAASPLHDAPVNLQTPSGLYVPQNYDREFRGWVSARNALAGSLNIPAVRVLMRVGLEPFVERLRALGFAHISENGDYYGYALALGSAEVSLWQLVNAYRTLATGGNLRGELSLTQQITDPLAGQQLFSAAAAFIITDALADRAARSSTFGLDNVLATPYFSAVKTGTSKDLRDNWCVGFSARYTVGVWVGNFDGAPMQNVSGVSGAAPVWRALMDKLHQHEVSSPPPVPAGVIAADIDFHPAIENPRREWFVRGTQMQRVEFTATTPAHGRIIYPGRDMVMAVDPDIPAAHQRVRFAARGVAAAQWRLNGELLSIPASGWMPRQGVHHLELVDTRGAVLDALRFQVRGTIN